MTLCRELGETGLHNGFVFTIRDAKPSRVRGQYLAGGQFAPDELANGEGNVAFTLELLAVFHQKLFKQDAELVEKIR